MKCSACSGRLVPTSVGVMFCEDCDGLHATLFRHDVSRLVHLDRMEPSPLASYWDRQEALDFDNMRFFDFTITEDDGSMNRVHGWFNRMTKNVVQFG